MTRRVRAFVVAGVVLLTLPLEAQQFVPPRNNEVELFLRNVFCAKTTEPGADEVYVLVLGKSSDGKSVATRIPANAPNAASGHWDMNDNQGLGCNRPSGDSYCIENKSLGFFSTASNTSWDVVVVFMEEDRGLGKNVEDIVRDAVANSGGDFIVGAVNLLLGLVTNDTDDFIGSVGAHITANSVTWRDVDRVRFHVPYPNDPLRLYGFEMNGDGAQYTAHIGLR